MEGLIIKDNYIKIKMKAQIIGAINLHTSNYNTCFFEVITRSTLFNGDYQINKFICSCKNGLSAQVYNVYKENDFILLEGILDIEVDNKFSILHKIRIEKIKRLKTKRW